VAVNVVVGEAWEPSELMTAMYQRPLLSGSRLDGSTLIDSLAALLYE
jgi:hypothetical protein